MHQNIPRCIKLYKWYFDLFYQIFKARLIFIIFFLVNFAWLFCFLFATQKNIQNVRIYVWKQTSSYSFTLFVKMVIFPYFCFLKVLASRRINLYFPKLWSEINAQTKCLKHDQNMILPNHNDFFNCFKGISIYKKYLLNVQYSYFSTSWNFWKG